MSIIPYTQGNQLLLYSQLLLSIHRSAFNFFTTPSVIVTSKKPTLNKTVDIHPIFPIIAYRTHRQEGYFLGIDIGQRNGMLYNLDVGEESINCIRSTLQPFDFLPIPDYNYGYYFAGPSHFTQRDVKSDFYQIFITHNGCGRLIVGETEYLIDKNSIFLLDLNIPHRYETVGNYWEYEWVNFCGTPCSYYCEKINPHGLVIYDLLNTTTLKSLLHDVGALAQQNGEQKYIQTGTQILQLLDALYSFSTECAQQKILPKKKDNIEKVKQYMEEHYADNISLDQLADMAYLSKYHFTRSFTNYIGVTPYKYLMSLRLNRARHMLLLTTMSIEEISFCTGFKNSKNLIRSFKQITGKTPEKYRIDTKGKT